MLRTVTGKVSRIDGSPWATEINFRLFPGSFDLISQYPSSIKRVTSGSDGLFSVSLWCNAAGLGIAHYECQISRDRFTFDLPLGTDPIDLGTLRLGSNPSSPPALVDEKLSPKTSSITQGDLIGDEVVVYFPSREVPVSVVVSNELLEEVAATNVYFLSNQAVRVSLAGYTPITGIWKIRVL